jgi:hypothetical protein
MEEPSRPVWAQLQWYKFLCLVPSLVFIQDEHVLDWFPDRMVLKYDVVPVPVFGYPYKERCQRHCTIMVWLPPFPGDPCTGKENIHHLPQFTQPFHAQWPWSF